LSGIIDAASDVVDELKELFEKGTNAFIALLVMLFVTIPLVGVLSTVAFDTVSQTFEDNSAAQTAIGGTETAYNIGGTIQDAYDVAKILWPVLVAIGGTVGAAIVLITKFRDKLEGWFNR
jgi:hypothetical protein